MRNACGGGVVATYVAIIAPRDEPDASHGLNRLETPIVLRRSARHAELLASRQFNSWLAEQRVSLAFTIYQSGKLFLIGLQPDGRLSTFERTFNRCLGLWRDGQTLWMTSLYQLWRFENALEPGQVANGYDRVYVPQVGYVTGDLDVRTNEVIVSGPSMPHSPRMYLDQLWLCDSGTGHFGRVDRTTGQFKPLTFCPGYMGELSFIGDYAVIGLSQCRENRTFQGMALDENLKQHDAEVHCGLCVIDLRSGDLVHWLWLNGVVRELYDVVVLPGVKRPSALGFKTDEIRWSVTIGSSQSCERQGASRRCRANTDRRLAPCRSQTPEPFDTPPTLARAWAH